MRVAKRAYGQSELRDTIFDRAPVLSHSERELTLAIISRFVILASLMGPDRRAIIEPFGIICPKNISKPYAREFFYQSVVEILLGPNCPSVANEQLVVVSTLD